MFENAELGQAIDKDTYKQAVPVLRASLLEAQGQLATAPFSVLVLVAGSPAAGKSEAVDLLLEWLDARGVQTHAMRKPTDEERQRPPLWRYWRDLPARGRMGIFFGGWESVPLLKCLRGQIDRARLDQLLDRYTDFERMLHREDTLLVKLWLHLSKKSLKKRLKKLEGDPALSWQVTRQDREVLRQYEHYRSICEQVVRRTSTGEAPWTIIEATQRRYRNLSVARTLLTALQERLEGERQKPPRPEPRAVILNPAPLNVIRSLDLGKTFPADDRYKDELRQAQGDLGRLTRELRQRGRSLILVFEGPDAAGKGGAIRRLTRAMDARDYRVIAVAAPTDEEKAHPYLWRFWRHLPLLGRVTIYDRSWYGRVLVERVEGFATTDEWQRAYAEINDFEAQLVEFGTVLIKFWLAISPEEQLRRFQDRQVTPYKQYKLTAEDWRNRAKWDTYEAAACDMIERTSTEAAPWVLAEAENKEHARVKVVRTVVHRLEQALAE
jgi:polyphosphate:AMP phosphotransferase